MNPELKTASAHDSPLTGRVEIIANRHTKRTGNKNQIGSVEKILSELMPDIESEFTALESSLSRAQERLKRISKFSDWWIRYSPTQEESERWKSVWHIATEDAKPSPEREEAG